MSVQEQYNYELAMSEIKDHVKLRILGRSWRGQRGNAYWIHQMLNSSDDVFVPKSVVKGLVEFSDPKKVAEFYVPDWFYKINEKDLKGFKI